MKTLKIFLSKKESYLNSAVKLAQECPLKTDILYIEHVGNEELFQLIGKDDIVYFLCNDSFVSNIIKKIQVLNCFIYNKNFLIKNYEKDDIQILLYKSGIKVPFMVTYEDIEKKHFPLFCKEKKHTGITFQSYNKSTLTRFFNKFELTDFYFEKSILGKDKPPMEFKVYYLNGEIFTKDGGLDLNNNIKKICSDISDCLDKIEVFSVDLVQTSNNYYVIDVNPASGFFLSSNARKCFLQKTITMSK
ncbi:MAG: hypothetical protein LBU87_01135 [Lactobacillales bacterium]|jgi:hypothetical protein|nr:hypothetical protein [Lactobacillales bacterium]